MKDKIRRRRHRERLTEGREALTTARQTSDPAATADILADVATSPEFETNVHTHKHSLEVKSGYNMYCIFNPAQRGIFRMRWDLLMSHLAHHRQT